MSRPELDAIDAALRGEGELAELVADVRASAPRMAPELALRLEEIFVEPEHRNRWRAPRWLVPAAASLAVGAVAAVVAVGALRSGSDERATTAASAPAKSAGEAQSGAGRASTAPAVAVQRIPRPRVGTTVLPGRGPRRVERDVALTLAAAPRDFADVSDGVVRTTDRFGGIVQRSQVDQQGARGRASFDLRIPVGRLDRAMAALSELAHVRARSAGTEDVTGAYDSAADRLSHARVERPALLRALSRATTAEQAARLRDRLREVRERIARDRRAVDQLRRRTDLARIDVTVVSDRGASTAPSHDDGSWTPGDALHDAARVLEVAAGVAVVALAAALPLALLAAAAALTTRTTRRRRRDAALS